MGCSLAEAKEANDNFLNFYPGLKTLKEEVIPNDANAGWFKGVDGRLVRCDSQHLMLAGYLQNGESVVMKRATQVWHPRLTKEKVPFKLVDYVHDEWQTEVKGDIELAKYVAEIQADAIRQVGEDLNLNCPLAGSFMAEHGTYKIPNTDMYYSIGSTWRDTH